MIKSMIALFLFCCLTSNPKPYSAVWLVKHSEKRDFYDQRRLTKNKVFIPLVETEIAQQIIDSMIERGNIRDSLFSHREGPITNYLPQPIKIFEPNLVLLYNSKTIVRIGKCDYEIFNFSVDTTEDINSDNCYSFNYMRGVGLLECYHKLYQQPTLAWDRCILIDLRDRNEKSVVDKEKLTEILEKIANY